MYTRAGTGPTPPKRVITIGSIGLQYSVLDRSELFVFFVFYAVPVPLGNKLVPGVDKIRSGGKGFVKGKNHLSHAFNHKIPKGFLH